MRKTTEINQFLYSTVKMNTSNSIGSDIGMVKKNKWIMTWWVNKEAMQSL